MIPPQTSQIWHHHKVTNITVTAKFKGDSLVSWPFSFAKLSMTVHFQRQRMNQRIEVHGTFESSIVHCEITKDIMVSVSCLLSVDLLFLQSITVEWLLTQWPRFRFIALIHLRIQKLGEMEGNRP